MMMRLAYDRTTAESKKHIMQWISTYYHLVIIENNEKKVNIMRGIKKVLYHVAGEFKKIVTL